MQVRIPRNSMRGMGRRFCQGAGVSKNFAKFVRGMGKPFRALPEEQSGVALAGCG